MGGYELWRHIYKRGAQNHERRPSLNAGEAADNGLWGMIAFAFALGFAHEEEFSIIALCAGRANCWAVMAPYAAAVAASILGLTMISVATFNRFRSRLEPWAGHLPLLSGLILGLIGFGYLFGRSS